MKKSLLLTVDFEDIYHDYLSTIYGKSEDIKIKEIGLYKSYESLKGILKKLFNDEKITFFCTGIIAEKYPEIIYQIKKDGNEIACHHYYHDHLSKKKIYEFEKEIELSKKKIYDACKYDVIGYRAPYFSINDNMSLYNVLKKYFKYDASYFDENKEDNFLKNEIDNFTIIKIYRENFLNFKVRTGGSFFRFLTQKKISNILNNSHVRGIIPQIYLHPYDILSNREFFVKFEELVKLNLNKKIYYWAKQFQWHYLNNNSVIKKLKFISHKYKLIGTIEKNLDKF